MVTPAARREAVAHLEQGYEMSERRACSVSLAAVVDTSISGYQAPAVFAAQLTAMGDQLRATELLRRSPIAPSAQPRQIQPPTLVSAG